MSMQKLIFQAMKTKLATLSWAKYIDYEKIRILSSDFKDHELPCIQFYDTGERSRNIQGRDEITWDISLELVMKKNPDEVIDQGVLLDRRLEIKRKMGEDPTLGLQAGVPASEGRMIHVRYAGGVTDLHVLETHYIARMDFQAIFEEPFVVEC